MRHGNIEAVVEAAAAYKGDVEDHERRVENRRQKRARLAKSRKVAGAKRRVRS